MIPFGWLRFPSFAGADKVYIASAGSGSGFEAGGEASNLKINFLDDLQVHEGLGFAHTFDAV